MVSVVVCTYNRSEILRDCLTSLAEQTASKQLYEVLVVDNNSTDNTGAVVQEFLITQSNFKYVKEDTQGLSAARNKGASVSSFDWVLYMDDDALATVGMVDKAIYDIRHYSFDCFGGTYTAWFKYGKPRWMTEDFGTKIPLSNSVTEIFTSQLDGGLFCIRKDVLQAAGGFPLNLGMSGNKISYGEETALQEKLLQLKYSLGFDPELKMEHLVGKHKLNIWWHFKSEYARGRDSMRSTNATHKTWSVWLQIKTIARQLLIDFPNNLKKLKSKNYYIENVLLDTFKPLAFRYGQQNSIQS